MRPSVPIISFILVLLIFLPGCGKKGDPLPPDVATPPPVSHLAAGLAEQGIVLTWDIPRMTAGGERFRIFRRELDATECPGCTQEYGPIADFAVTECTVTDGAQCSWQDAAVKPDRLYGYRVAVCTGSGYCGAAPDEVIIRSKGGGTQP